MKKLIAVLCLGVLVGCDGGGLPGPAKPEAVTVSQIEAKAPVSASGLDPKLKPGTFASIQGNTVVGVLRTIYNEDIGPVAMLVFPLPANNSSVASDLQNVVGPAGTSTYFAADITGTCGVRIQVDFVRAPHGITANMRANEFYPSDFIDAEFLSTQDCPNHKRVPPVVDDVCPNIEGVQDNVPTGYRFNPDNGFCVPNLDCTLTPNDPACTPRDRDYCSNLPGVQTSLPEQTKLVGTECLPLTCGDEGYQGGSCTECTVQTPPADTTVYSDWGACTETDGVWSQSRTKTVTDYNNTPACIIASPVITITTEYKLCTPPPPAPCLYNVQGNPNVGVVLCAAENGTLTFDQGVTHCAVAHPGTCNSFFHLTGGQSGDGCRKPAGNHCDIN